MEVKLFGKWTFEDVEVGLPTAQTVPFFHTSDPIDHLASVF